MKLIYSSASPYARTARIVVRELSLLAEVEEIAQHPFDNPAQLISFNPLCRVPCLVDGKQKAIYDSQVICEYLNDYANGDLFLGFDKNWQWKTWYSLTRGLLDSAVAWQQDKTRDVGPSPFWEKRLESSIDRGLSELQKKIPEFPENFSILDINLVALLDYLDFRHQNYEWQERHSELARWKERFEQKRSFLETMPSA